MSERNVSEALRDLRSILERPAIRDVDEDQSRVCRISADRQGWTVVATFEDAALSGFGIEHRLGYQQLLAAALSPTKPFDVILVEDLSRLTRDMAEILRIYHRLGSKASTWSG